MKNSFLSAGIKLISIVKYRESFRTGDLTRGKLNKGKIIKIFESSEKR